MAGLFVPNVCYGQHLAQRVGGIAGTIIGANRVPEAVGLVVDGCAVRLGTKEWGSVTLVGGG